MRDHAGVQTLAGQFRQHAAYCDLTAPLYAVLLRAFALDWERGGPVRAICAGREDGPAGEAVQLRLLGALHRLVLTGRAPELVPYYRSSGGRAEPAHVWPAARAVLVRSSQELVEGLAVPPQTNEVGRAAPLVLGLLAVRARLGVPSVRLLELGASAGLLLLVDRFRVTGTGWAWGPADSPVDLTGAVHGDAGSAIRVAAGAGVEITDRRGCDLQPVDPRSAEGRLRLTSFVWPDHPGRHRRLAGALDLAARHPAPVDAEPAAAWLHRVLGAGPGVPTVVWHSVMRQYVPDPDWADVRTELDAARRRMPVVELGYEPPEPDFLSAPVLTLDGERLAHGAAHGVPCFAEPGS
jgi:hypothetical protein